MWYAENLLSCGVPLAIRTCIPIVSPRVGGVALGSVGCPQHGNKGTTVVELVSFHPNLLRY